MFKFKSKHIEDLSQADPTPNKKNTKAEDRGFYRSKGFIIAACLALVLGIATNARSVLISNFTVLAAAIPGAISNLITAQMVALQNKVIAEMKKPAGMGAITALKAQITDNTAEKIFANANLADTSKIISDDFGEGKTMGNFGEYNQGNYQAMVLKQYSVPSVASGHKPYMSSIRDISLLMAGPGESRTSAENKALPLADLRNKKMGDVLTQSRIGAFESAGSAAYMAQKVKENAEKINITNDSSGHDYPEKAIKDIAKLTYYDVMLRAEQLQMQAKEIQRAALMNR